MRTSNAGEKYQEEASSILLRAQCYHEVARWLDRRGIYPTENESHTSFFHFHALYLILDRNGYDRSWSDLSEKHKEKIVSLARDIRPFSAYPALQKKQKKTVSWQCRPTWTFESDPYHSETYGFSFRWQHGLNAIREAFGEWLESAAPIGTPGKLGKADITGGKGHHRDGRFTKVLEWLQIVELLDRMEDYQVVIEIKRRTNFDVNVKTVNNAQKCLNGWLQRWADIPRATLNQIKPSRNNATPVIK